LVHYRQRSEVGKTGVFVSKLGLGGGGIGGLYNPVPQEQAIGTVTHALELGISYLDTAPLYGLGKSEIAVGKALDRRNSEDFVISTKVGILISDQSTTYDFSGDAIRKSFESSLLRLGLKKVDIVFIHDPVDHYKEALTKAYPVLRELKSRGIIRAIGVGMNEWEMEERFAKEGEFDCFLLAGRYTLLDQTALSSFLLLAQKKGISIILGGPFNSGILASDLSEDTKYNYTAAPQEILNKARRISKVCNSFNVPLKAAALQFPLAHPAITSVLSGARSSEEITENVEMIQYPIPKEMWEELIKLQLIDPRSPIPE